jgi:class 3 adenylate cyclase/pimeloyl-ACP methyl ester carboxylesterase
MNVPTTRYVSVGESDVAYQVIGRGSCDILYSYGLGAHLDVAWDSPLSSSWLERLASFSRLIVFDRRGTGASDGIPRGAMPTWEEWTDDMLAVLDAAGSERAAVFSTLDAGPISILFASMHPERVNALILLTTAARYLRADDYPMGASPAEIDGIIGLIEQGWGTPEFAQLMLPDMSDNPEYLRHVAKMLRASATPRTAAAQFDYILRSIDVRDALPLIQAPTLVLHARDSSLVPIEHGRFLAEHIPGSKFVSLSSSVTGISPDDFRIPDEIAEFLTGERPQSDIDRVLTTVLFTDIVGSTERAASLGDRQWLSFLEVHNRAVRDQLHRHRGREVKTTGDGFVAAFDGPARAIRCGQSLVASTRELGIEVRIGLHTGECDVRGDDLGGLAVHIAARVAALAGPGQVVVSGTVKDLVAGSELEFADLGDQQLKGVPGTWRLFSAKP